MKNLLKLHEAVAVVLLGKQNRTSTFEEIAQEIENRNLFPERKGGITLAEQIKLRTSISSSRYKHMFDFSKPNLLTLK
ncbi:hypothetical protein [Pedobacter sp. Hv1]|uniref:hypothetical protein n=1 Tax=Pedobacter sp. Hv1 TaxID=1740090 RepID=UPI0006D8CDDD|nr:hypothetical protein [Pedobacter sp. Hv1]KQC00948.1 hypothetical protein AQF98_09765 [Pedobacter sp. Hv1]